jgi:hypothetical protein
VAWTTIVHGVCFAILAIVEHPKVIEYFESSGWNMMWIETVSRYTNIYMNQGLFFTQAHFFLYTIMPRKMGESAIGRFATLDAFCLLMMFDILIFTGTLASLVVFLIRGTIQDEDYEEFLKLDKERSNDLEIDGDFLSVNFYFKRRLAAMSCNAFMNIFVLYLIHTDSYQQPYAFQYLLALFEILFVVLIYMPRTLRKIAVYLWLASRILLLVFAPIYLYIAANENEEIKQNNPSLVANCLIFYMLMYESLNTPLTLL